MVGRFFYRVFCGFFLGVSIFAPGFSGSIVAIMMGIYQDLLEIISNPFKRLKENIKFCFPLGIGAAISLVVFVIAFNFLFETNEKATYLLFVGLIVGNLPIVYSEVKQCGFRKRYLFSGCGALVVALALALVSMGTGHSTVASGITSGLPYLIVSGLVAGATALVPGMSVSMVLILFGVYGQVIHAAESVLHLDTSSFLPLGVFFISAVAGLVIASRLIKAVFKKHPGVANTAVFGFMAGSLLGVLVQSLRMEDEAFTWWHGTAALAIGLGISMLFVLMGRYMKEEKKKDG